MRPLMVLGCTSDAGKSLLVTALCRWFTREGVRVAPFKAQNMSNNARVVGGLDGAPGGEIGVAQWLQAKAAKVEPEVRMNPVLLKPEADTQSQVVVRGVVDRELTNTPWKSRHDALWTPMAESFDDLAGDFDLVVIEGAGSPAEINLRDQVNNRMIEYSDAAGLLASDIDRGGSFAHLYGTWALVPDATRERLAGYVLNRFRGDASLLAPGPERLTEMTGMACAGVMPMLRHDLPREEGASEVSSAPAGAPKVVIPRFPYGSNLDEFHLLGTVARIEWATGPAAFEHLDSERDLIVLPGSKHVGSDLEWLRAAGIAAAVASAAQRGVRVIGVCGGAMMLSRSIEDPHGVEGGAPGSYRGLGLVDSTTTMGVTKRTVRTVVEALGSVFDGYEIRYGELAGGERFVTNGRVMATTVHGLFEHSGFIERLLGVPAVPVLEPTFELLADAIEEHLDTDLLRRLIG
jgi:adenosylcobyric acid synthase